MSKETLFLGIHSPSYQIKGILIIITLYYTTEIAPGCYSFWHLNYFTSLTPSFLMFKSSRMLSEKNSKPHFLFVCLCYTPGIGLGCYSFYFSLSPKENLFLGKLSLVANKKLLQNQSLYYILLV